MPRRRILLPWTQQPTEYGGLDETNLFAGITSALYTPRLEITRGLLMLGEAGAPLDAVDQPGEVMQIATSGGSTSAREFLSGPIDLTGPYSVAIRLRRLGASSGAYDRIAHANGSNTGANRCGFLMTSNSDGNPNRIYWLQSDASSNLVQTYSPNWPAISTTGYDVCVVVANGSTLQMYVNGVAYNTFACTTFPGVMANPFRFGTDGAGANGAPVNVEFVHFMRGALTADQVREYTDNPWQIFEPQAIWAAVSSSAPAAFNSAWARNANTLIGACA